MRGFWSFIFLTVFIGLSKANAETLILLDFDGVIVQSRAAEVDEHGGFPTRFRLFKNFYRSNTLQSTEGADFIDVTAAELEAMESYIAKADGKPGSLNKVFKLSNGVEIIPGHYHLRTPDSFFQFHEGKDGTNYLVKALKEALARDPSGKSWKGKYWDYFVTLLSHPETAKQVGIVSARAHSTKEWMEFFEVLKAEGLIQNLPNPQVIFSISRRDFDRFSLDFNSTKQKTALLEEIAIQLGRRPLTSSDLRIDADGRGYAKTHSLIYIEDRPEIVESVAHMFRRLATGRIVPVKFSIFNAGSEQEIRDLGRPALTILTSTGLYRAAGRSEIWGDFKDLEAKFGSICTRMARKLSGRKSI